LVAKERGVICRVSDWRGAKGQTTWRLRVELLKRKRGTVYGTRGFRRTGSSKTRTRDCFLVWVRPILVIPGRAVSYR